ncbi:SDR family NAD(P)-dependent oxidoreductase, partial [uncultured Bilophila sp.]|uniref:NAD(P)-dependent oxidoreductase n=1 Tax=uncultured Bilophila sp. TaxID=529385 RepID=UPI00262E448E
EASFGKMFDINVKGVFLCAQACARQMLKQGGGVIVNMSTVDPGVNVRMAERLEPAGIAFADAPVLGSPSGVGSWAFAVGASEGTFARIKDVLLILSGSEERLFHIGPVGYGNRLKLLNNMMLGAINACAVEIMALADHMGLSQKTLIDVAVAANARVLSNAYKEIGGRIVEGRYDEPTFTVDMLIKDNRLCLDMANDYGAPLVVGAAVDYVHRMAAAQGYGPKDHAVAWKAVARNWKA